VGLPRNHSQRLIYPSASRVINVPWYKPTPTLAGGFGADEFDQGSGRPIPVQVTHEVTDKPATLIVTDDNVSSLAQFNPLHCPSASLGVNCGLPMRNDGLEGSQAGWESLFPAGFHPPGPVMRSLFDKPRREGQSRFRLHAAQVSFFDFAVAEPVLRLV
jgi:hypothetical protein